MAEKLQVYKCEACGNIVEVLHGGEGELVCCDAPMKLMEESTEDTGYEKHVPVTTTTDFGLKVIVGSVPHPMEQEHYIEWIEIIVDGKAYREFLEPGQAPEALFQLPEIPEDGITVREYCNVHGLWKA